MNRFESSSEVGLPRMWQTPNNGFQYKDTALEAAHLEIGRLQSNNEVQQLLLDEATSRISDLAKYQAKAAVIIARLSAKVRTLSKQERRRHAPAKDAGLTVPSYERSRIRDENPGQVHAFRTRPLAMATSP